MGGARWGVGGTPQETELDPLPNGSSMEPGRLEHRPGFHSVTHQRHDPGRENGALSSLTQMNAELGPWGWAGAV